MSRIINVTGAILFLDVSEYIRELSSEDVTILKCYEHEKLKRPSTHLDNQKFLQQKMQGKRRVY